MKSHHFSKCRTIAACTGISLVGSLTALAGPAAPEPVIDDTPSEEPATNWIEVAIGGASVDGNDAAFQHRNQTDGDFYGGIESFRMEQFTDNGLFLMEGRAMFGLDDYMLKLRYDRDDVGYVEAGYKQFRTWYDGSGGFIPPADFGLRAYGDDLHLDRGEVWIEAGLRMPDVPQITFSYRHLWRDGQKDGLNWGRGARGNLPTLWDIDETTDIFTLDLLHDVGNTTLGAGLRYQMNDTDDSRDIFTRGRNVTQTDTYDTDIFSAHVNSETRFGERALLSFAYNFTTMDGDIGGDRLSFDPAGNFLSKEDHNYFGLMGGVDKTINTLGANLWWQATEDLVVIPSLRAEWWEQDAWGWHIAGIHQRGGGDPAGATEQEVMDALMGIWPTRRTLDEVIDTSNWDWEQFTEAIELRYDGIDNVLVYAEAEFSQMDTDMFRSTFHDDQLGNSGLDERNSRSDMDSQKYTLGLNWYAAPGLSFHAQAYHLNSEMDYNHVGDALLDQHNYETDDFNIRMTWRAAPNLTLVSRYDYQNTTYEAQPYGRFDAAMMPLPVVRSGDIERHIFSQSVSWTPVEWMYVQGGLFYMDAATDSGGDQVTSGNYYPDWETETWMANLNVGFALDDRTNLQVGYIYYEADNYVDNSADSMPYGTDATEHAITVRLNRLLNPNMTWNLGYGYYTSDDDAYGGNNDYDAHVVSTGFRYTF